MENFALAKAQDRIAELELALAMAVREEREACALIAESWFGQADEVAADIASRIRARSAKQN